MSDAPKTISLRDVEACQKQIAGATLGELVAWRVEILGVLVKEQRWLGKLARPVVAMIDERLIALARRT